MEEVKEGDELLVVNFGDPLHKSLSDRVDELNDPWDDEDDEDCLLYTSPSPRD